ncbi:MAG TPA: PH domain-containing protein [Planctomycetota bacterium]|nr:PH domain-containing protein [Planctomycetota bacterium]
MRIHRGLGWRHRSTIPLAGITRIESRSGPVSRIFGLSDLVVYTTSFRGDRSHESPSASLLGVRERNEIRTLLLERRRRLHEAALLGEVSLARTPQDLQRERLATAIKRLERRLPGPPRR